MTADIRWVDKADSTNSLMAAQAAELAHGCVIAAREQTRGRGQRGNSWESEPGRNLSFSILLRPASIKAAMQFRLSMIVALAVCEILEDVSGRPFKIKWPNDIYFDDRKICGILIENSLIGSDIAHSIAGIGINVNQQSFISDAPNPVSLIHVIGRETGLEPLLEKVCRRILDRLDSYEATHDETALNQDFMKKLWRNDGCFYDWKEPASDTPFRARIVGVEPDGRLCLGDGQGRLRKYYFKEVAAVL